MSVTMVYWVDCVTMVAYTDSKERRLRESCPYKLHRSVRTRLCKMFFFRMSKGEQPQEHMDVLVSRARAALRVWKSFRRRDERLYTYWAKHLEAEVVSARRVGRLP